MKNVLYYIFIFLITLAPFSAQAEKIPRHMNHMAAQLYKGLDEDLRKGESLPPARREVLQKSLKILQDMKIERWSATPATVKGGSKMEKLGKDHILTNDAGQTVQMKWNPETEKFFIKVFDDGKSGGEEFVANFTGDVKVRPAENGKDMILDTAPTENPLQLMTAEDIEGMRANILGEWTAEDGTVYTFSAAEEIAGDVLLPREHYEEKIEKVKDDLKAVKSAKVFKWENPENGKIIEQEKYRRLKEPFEYLGEDYALDDAEDKIVALEKEIADLEAERDGMTLPPVRRFDPAGYRDMKSSEGSRTISVHVKRPDGHVYTYDEAAFDGRRITARRTYKVIEDFSNQKLPKIIKEMLLRDGWEPPGWLDLEAFIDIETGNLVLEGQKWALKVTYSSFFGTDHEIKSTHTPWPTPQLLKRDGGKFEVAEGAAKDFVP